MKNSYKNTALCTHYGKDPISLVVYLTAVSTISLLALTSSFAKGPAGVPQQAEMAEVRIQESADEAKALLQKGDEAIAAKDYEAAYIFYLDAVEKIPAGTATEKLRQTAVKKFSKGAVAYAEWLVTRGRYSEAEQAAKTVLLPQFDPTYKPAIVFLSRLEQPDYFNKTVTSEFAEDKDKVSLLLQQAQGYYSSGRYDLATRRYEEVLNIDPWNNAARKGMEKNDLARGKYYREAYNETRSRMLLEVNEAWETAVPRMDRTQIDDSIYQRDLRGTELIQAKLNQIIIPSIELNDASLADAVDFLIQQSQRLDPGTDGEKRGVNIVIRQSAAGASTSQMTEDGEVPATATNSAARRVSLALKNIPLYVALDYLAQLSDTRIKVEPFAVSLVPLSEPIDSLVTKEYRVPPGFIPPGTVADPENTGSGFGNTTIQPTQGIAAKTDAQVFLSSQGISFPPGSSARYIPVGSKLIVRNTQQSIDLIDSLVAAAVGAPPTQVQVESKFIEITQNNLDELGFDWLLGPLSIGGGVYGSGGDARLIDAGGYPFVQSSLPVGNNTLTRGLRSGSGIGPGAGISANSIDSLLGGALATGGPAPAFFGIAGIFTNPQFQVLIRGLSQKKGVDLMTAPTVTTKSGQKATIRVSRRFFYPTEFDPPQIPQSTTSVSRSGDPIFLLTAQESAPPPTVTPSHPSGWTERDIGVSMDVEPIIGPDSYTIDITLTPQVVDFDGFINYGSSINAVGYSRPAELGGLISVPGAIALTDNVINQPIFSTRRVTTQVTIWDGQTVALGGLMREDVQKVQDKVPFLGDIPIAGRLFRSNIDQKVKRNLIIFVTAKIVDAKGELVRRDDEEVESVDLLGLPASIPGPEYRLGKGGGK
ncbi:MAG: Amuc_1098 family type IV pilus outer membrane protein [Chthoniobacterales bacterium]